MEKPDFIKNIHLIKKSSTESYNKSLNRSNNSSNYNNRKNNNNNIKYSKKGNNSEKQSPYSHNLSGAKSIKSNKSEKARRPSNKNIEKEEGKEKVKKEEEDEEDRKEILKIKYNLRKMASYFNGFYFEEIATKIIFNLIGEEIVILPRLIFYMKKKGELNNEFIHWIQ